MFRFIALVALLSAIAADAKVKLASKDIDAKAAESAYVKATGFGARPFEKAELAKMVSEPATIDVADDVALVTKLRERLVVAAGLSSNETDAVNDYSGGGYKRINSNLRALYQAESADKVDVTTLRGLDKERKFITDLASALKKMQKETGVLHRKISFATLAEYNAVADKLTAGGEVEAPQFDSTTFKSDVSLPDNKPFELAYTITAVGKNGGYLSGYCNIIPKSEAEVLFPPGTKFTVQTAATKPKPDATSFKGTVAITEKNEVAADVNPPSADYLKQRIRDQLLGSVFAVGKVTASKVAAKKSLRDSAFIQKRVRLRKLVPSRA